MKEPQALRETYTDLLHDETDQAFIQLVQKLDSLCNVPQSPPSVNWRAVKAMHIEQTTRKRATILPFRSPARLRYLLFRKAVFVPVLIALVLVTAAFTFTLSPLMNFVLSLQPSGQSLIDNHLFVDVHQSQTVGGKTVTLQNGYADASQIVLGYTISPTNAFGTIGTPDLNTRQGVKLLPDVNQTMAMSSSGNTEGASFHFSSSRITGNPSILELRLKLSISSRTAPGRFKELGIATFNFTLPFHPGKVLNPGQQVTSYGKTATLEHVSIAPSSTRITVLGLDKNAAPSELLQPAGKAAGPLDDISFGTDEPGAWSFIYDGDFSKDPGLWTFTIKQGVNTWVFHFVVPA